MPKPVCVPCQRFMRVEENGYTFIEGMPIVNGALPGNREPEKWIPYKIWQADRWKCPDCGAEILCGFGRKPLREKHDKDFENVIIRTNASQLLVKDC